MKTIAVIVVLGVLACAQTAPLDFLNRGRPMVDAHNCYPYEGRWRDRIDRALSAGFPVSIEQDIASYQGRAVVSHTPKTTGVEPTLRDHFFERVRPVIEKTLAEKDVSRWPLIVLHFDFKSNDEPLLHEVWNLLGEYEGWITTARKTANPRELAPFEPKPLLVITEAPDAQEEVFFRRVKAGDKLRVFGSARSLEVNGKTRNEREHLAATLPPEELLSEPPTNYRRWWNNSWHAVEEGGQRNAGEWTRADEDRLHALVDHAHKLGYWIRFYTLDGFSAADDRGWDANYNFGSREAAAVRWRAAIRAGVDFIATDQYEELAATMKEAK
jgi:hypothetical protein